MKDNQHVGELLLGLERITNWIGQCAIYELCLATDLGIATRLRETLTVLYVRILSYLANAKYYYTGNPACKMRLSVDPSLRSRA